MWRQALLFFLLLAFAIALSAVDSFDPSPLWGLLWLGSLVTWVACVIFVRTSSHPSNRLYQLLQRGLLIVVGPPLSLTFFSVAGDYVHLAADYREYEQVASVSPGATHSFDWGEGGFVGSYQFSRKLVYSPSSPPQLDAAEWQSQVGGSVPGWSVKHLIGHYYVVEMSQG